MHVFVVGYPSSMGGADSELWHVLKLWRQHAVDVTLIPTWSPPADWQQKCAAIGAKTCVIPGPAAIPDIPDVTGSLVISFCNGDFLRHAAIFRQLGCRIAWVGCMTWLFDAELAHYAEYGSFDAYVFQSRFQRDTLFPRLCEYGVNANQCHLIRGAFDPDEFPFRPLRHASCEPLVVGRLSRVDAHKWHPDTWRIYSSIECPSLRGRVMAWEERLIPAVGPAPPWVETVSAGNESPQTFLQSLHCLVQLSGLATENWPRVGLEAMATGVPVVTDRRGGWLEMIDDGKTGFLVDRPHEAAFQAGRLAASEDLRMDVAWAARERLATDLADPHQISPVGRIFSSNCQHDCFILVYWRNTHS
jgi:glycosyltransferase involved in cell wall biosynthesis